MQNQRDLLVFILAVVLLFIGWYFVKDYVLPKPVDPVVKSEGEKEGDAKEPKESKPLTLSKLPNRPTPTEDAELEHLRLGGDTSDSPYELLVVLDPLGGGVRSVLLNKFNAATPDGRPTKDLLELVPADAQRQNPAFVMNHYGDDAERPLDTLARVPWEVVRREAGEWRAVTDRKSAVVTSDGESTQQISFRRSIDGVTIVKTYSLTQGQYHVGLKIEMTRSGEAKDKRSDRFQYQLAGARGLPVEGKWYTNIFRDAYICQVNSDNSPLRNKQDLRQIGSWGNGDFADPESGRFIRYAAVAVQYFASAIVVDDQQEEGQHEKFLRRARPTLETLVIKGVVKAKGESHFVLVSSDGKTSDVIDVPAKLLEDLAALKENQPVAVVCEALSYNTARKGTPRLAQEIRTGRDAENTHAIWEDDITVRVNTESFDIAVGKTVTHKYLLYHGPIKPSLLRHVRGEDGKREVNQDLVDRYADKLQLNQMTDYPTRGYLYEIGYWTNFSRLVTFCTNVIHRVMGWMTWVIPSYGLCILILTVLVRGMMFPLSRRQAMMGIKMQELGPEIKRIGEEFKDDQAAKGQAIMELYKKHGVNPLGSCWIMLLQMPVFMGLYFALQESIQFRLAGFWPTWITNLAAPDMMIHWGRDIPIIGAIISNDSAYGGFLYLGPYFNLLPIIAISLMLVQQKMMTPPPADEQQEMQQKMMKYMMVFMCLMFYKVAAGLCIYFIASSLWGFAERKLLPKAKKPEDGTDSRANTVIDAPAAQGSTIASVAATSGKKGRNKRKNAAGKQKEKATKEEPASRLGKWRKQLGDWWTDVLEQARKK